MRDFNFFRPYLDNESLSQKTRLTIVIASILIFVSMAGLYVGNMIKISGVNNEIKQMEIITNSPKSKKIKSDLAIDTKKLDKTKQYYEELKKVSSTVHSKDVIKSELIRKISSTTPEKVFFQSIKINDKTVEIEGTSDSRISAAKLLKNIRALDIFEQVSMPSINSSTETSSSQLEFKLTCTFKGGENNEQENK